MKKVYYLSIAFLLLSALSHSGNIHPNIADEYQNDYPASYDYNEADYNDVSENESDEENKETETDRTLTFISTPKTFVVNEGDAIKLPCNVDNLENLLIIWKRGSRIIALGEKPYEDDDSRVQVESTANGNTLVIRLSEEKDAGEYVCQVSTKTPVELKHTVKIIVRPKVESIPKSGLLTVKAGETAELNCKVTRGSPEPDVYWKRKKRPMPSGEQKLSGLSITFPKTSRHHSGLYTCYADNGWRMPATATIRLDVQHAPEVEQEMMTVLNKENTETKITCTIHASPLATVEWYKDGHLLVMKDNVITKRGNRHTLLLTGIREEDRKGSFECRARNDLGEASKVIAVTTEDSDATHEFEEHDRTQDIQNKKKIHIDKEDWKDDEKEGSSLLATDLEDSQSDPKVSSAETQVSDNTKESDKKILEFSKSETKKEYHEDMADHSNNRQEQEESQTGEEGSSLLATDLEDFASDPKAEHSSAESKLSDDINDSVEKIPKISKSETKEESHEVTKPEKLRDTSAGISHTSNFYLSLILSIIYTLRR